MFRSELRKAFLSPYTLSTYIFACALVIYSSVIRIIRSTDELALLVSFWKDNQTIPLSIYSWYFNWLPVDRTNTTHLFFFLLPLLILVPYAWSMTEEFHSGYILNIKTRIDVKRYMVAKMGAVFLSAFLLALIALILSFLLLTLFLPFYSPEVRDQFYSGIYHDMLFGSVYYTCPALFVIGYTLYISVTAGIFSVFISQLYPWLKNRFVITLFPFICLIGLELVYSNLIYHIFPYGITVSQYWSRAVNTPTAQDSWYTALGIPLLMLIASFALVFLNARKSA